MSKKDKECLKCGNDFVAWDDEEYCEECKECEKSATKCPDTPTTPSNTPTIKDNEKTGEI